MHVCAGFEHIITDSVSVNTTVSSPVYTMQVQKYSTTILSAMMAGMDDKEDPEDYITIEAMSGLSRIMSEIDESHIRAILINVALKIRPCFEKVSRSVLSCY